ncbi:hypothetical protein [Sporichthya polymorpha]|uniref:hypothetical protein n=1 Tax=Sporichthya polymorpha TaxID=35751 RepID=UPI0003677635|nr:hypothetical protein [Sporichthya polymorpha]
MGAGVTVRTLHPYAGDARPERLDVGGAGAEAGAITVDLTLAAAEDELFVGRGHDGLVRRDVEFAAAKAVPARNFAAVVRVHLDLSRVRSSAH